MKYNKIIRGIFHNRPNRFIANVYINDELETVHVKNTGRCKELLIPGVEVILEVSDNPARKTKYDIIAVYKEGLGLVNIDSQLCNKVAYEWLKTKDYDYIKPEHTYGASRVDFYMERKGEKYLMEVKGCTLEIDGIGYFPDAPTERGVKHLQELTRCIENGFCGAVLFVIQMKGIKLFRPHDRMHPAFGEALRQAQKAGVRLYAMDCNVTAGSIEIDSPVAIDLTPEGS